tara:strand:+ start:2115 stop:2462 length:348 start_codon:yes stop_codon:yes gene_type:complete
MQRESDIKINVYRFLFGVSVILISYGAFTPSEGNVSVIFLDKVFHFGAFFLLSFLLDRSIRNPLISHKGLVICLIIFALSIEIIQSFLPSRSAEIFDFVADLLGILVYLYFAPRK